MSLLAAAVIVVAGFAAGAVNAIVGSGSLITYPTLVALGVPPVTANVANTIGLVPGSVTGALGYRHELRAQRRAVRRLVPPAVLGAVVGAALLATLPSSTFQVVVPGLILLSTLLVAVGPRLARASRSESRTRWGPLAVAVLLSSVYGGYFSAAQGVLLLGILGVFLASGLQEQNALKNLLQSVVNVISGVFFVAAGRVAWEYAGLVALGSALGAVAGAALARRVDQQVFRIGIVIFGLVVAVVLSVLTFR